MADPQAAVATQLRNIEKKTGRTFAELCRLIADSGHGPAEQAASIGCSLKWKD